MNVNYSFTAIDCPVTLIKNEDGTYFATIEELPGCITEGDTMEEALEMIADAKQAWIKTALQEIPKQ